MQVATGKLRLLFDSRRQVLHMNCWVFLDITKNWILQTCDVKYQWKWNILEYGQHSLFSKGYCIILTGWFLVLLKINKNIKYIRLHIKVVPIDSQDWFSFKKKFVLEPTQGIILITSVNTRFLFNFIFNFFSALFKGYQRLSSFRIPKFS